MNTDQLFSDLEICMRGLTQAIIKLGALLHSIRAHEPTESFWKDVDEIGITPEYCQFAIDAYEFAAKTPDAAGLPMGHFFLRLAGGDQKKCDEFFEIHDRHLCKMYGLNPNKIDAGVL